MPWRDRGIPVYGLYPYPVDNDTIVRMHGNDERVRVDALRQAADLMYRVFTRFRTTCLGCGPTLDINPSGRCYHSPMRQLITRIDDDLHRRLKQRAAEQDRSLNDLVTSILAAAVRDEAESLRERIERSGLRVYPPPSTRPLTRSYEEILESTRGMGTAASDALAEERDARW